MGGGFERAFAKAGQKLCETGGRKVGKLTSYQAARLRGDRRVEQHTGYAQEIYVGYRVVRSSIDSLG